MKFVDNGALSLRFKFPEVEGVPKNLVYGRQIFALKKDRSVVPHGHNNMATAFLILKGDLRGRHYDRLKDEPDHYIIRPTVDRTFAPGECSTVSDYKDNVHWFKAITEPAFIFNLHVLQVNPDNREPTGRLYLDPEGEKLADGLVPRSAVELRRGAQVVRVSVRPFDVLVRERVVTHDSSAQLRRGVIHGEGQPAMNGCIPRRHTRLAVIAAAFLLIADVSSRPLTADVTPVGPVANVSGRSVGGRAGVTAQAGQHVLHQRFCDAAVFRRPGWRSAGQGIDRA